MSTDPAARRAAARPTPMASGALVRDAGGRVLLVEPTYKPVWEVPGGVVETGESPRAACEREVAEELGLRLRPGRLLCVQWHAGGAGRLVSQLFLYDGGVLPDGTPIALRAGELASWRFVEPDCVGELVAPGLAVRIAAALTALAEGRLVEVEDGVVLDVGAPAWAALDGAARR